MKTWLLFAFMFLVALCGQSQTVAHPTFSPLGGTITGAINVTLTSTTSGASLFYCYSTSSITDCTGETVYSYPGSPGIYVNPTSTEYLCAYGTKTGYTTSITTCQEYIKSSGTAATPTISPTSGTYVMPQTITITDTTGGSTITYGTTIPAGGCTPGTTYTGAFSINPTVSETVCAYASASGLTNSPTVSSNYNVSSISMGDTIARAEPAFPLKSSCQHYSPVYYQFMTNTVNLDPWNPTATTPGSLLTTGGSSWEPSTNPYPGTFGPIETDDTGLQTLINGAAANTCVEVSVGTSGQDALVENLNFKNQNSSGQPVNVIIDGGVRVFQTRNLSDYSGSCGQWSTTWPSDLNCPKWITPTASGTSISQPVMFAGYGVLDGRGWDRFTSNTTCPSGFSACGFNTLKVLGYWLNHSSSWAGLSCSGCSSLGTGGEANGSNSFNWTSVNNVTMYKLTLLNPSQFVIYWGGSCSASPCTAGNSVPANNFLAWGIKILGCGECSNTDGYDPSYLVSNWSFLHGYINTGDNCVAIKSNGANSPGSDPNNYPWGLTQNGTIAFVQTGNCIGVTIGDNAGGGVQNVLGQYLIQQPTNVNTGQQWGHGIGASDAGAAAIENVTYAHNCIGGSNMAEYSIQYRSTGTMSGINELDTTILSGTTGQLKLEGTSGNIIPVTLDQLTQYGSVAQSNSYVSVTPGPNGVSANIWSAINGSLGTSSSIAANASPITPAATPCVAYSKSTYNNTTAGEWQPLIGELWFSVGTTQDNLQTLSPAAPASYTLNATLFPATAYPSTKESQSLNFTSGPHTGTQAAPYASIEFLDNGNLIAACSGTNAVQLIHGDEFAQCPLTSVAAGTHVYTARYNVNGYDTNYPGGSSTTAFVWGNPGTGNALVATVTGGASSPVAPQITFFSVGP